MSLPPSHGQSSVQKYTPNGLLLTESDEDIPETHDNYFDRGTFPDSACAASSAPSGSTIPSSISNQAAAGSDEDLLEAAEAHAAKQRYHNFATEVAETIRSPPCARPLQFDDAAESLSVEEWVRFTAGVVPVSERTSLLGPNLVSLPMCAFYIKEMAALSNSLVDQSPNLWIAFAAGLVGDVELLRLVHHRLPIYFSGHCDHPLRTPLARSDAADWDSYLRQMTEFRAASKYCPDGMFHTCPYPDLVFSVRSPLRSPVALPLAAEWTSDGRELFWL